jgi:hypothetical protein
MTTLKSFLRHQMKFCRNAGNSYPEGHMQNWHYHGKAQAYQDLLDRLPEALLNNKLPESIWR